MQPILPGLGTCIQLKVEVITQYGDYMIHNTAQGGGNYQLITHDLLLGPSGPLDLWPRGQSLLSGVGCGKHVHAAAGCKLLAAPAGDS